MKFTKLGIALGVVIFSWLLTLGFWGTVIYVAYHFISKYW